MTLAQIAQGAGPALEAAKANLTLYVRRNIEQYFHLRETAQEAVAVYSDGVRKAVSGLTGTIVDDAYRIVGVLAAAVIAGIVQPDDAVRVARSDGALCSLYRLRAWHRVACALGAIHARETGAAGAT